MKKVLCLIMTVLLLFSFAACGGETPESPSSQESTGSTANVTVKFDDDAYVIGIEENIILSEHIKVEPAGTKLSFSADKADIITLYNATTGEFEGAKTGEVTVTVTAGSATATCKVVVQGTGTVMAREEGSSDFGIANRWWKETETPSDPNAKILIIPKNLTAGTDMAGAVALMSYADETYSKYDGYFVAKTDVTGNYEIKYVPEGEYVALIVSSLDYTIHKEYKKEDAVATFKASDMGKFFTDAEIDTLVGGFYNREFIVKQLIVTANQVNVLGHVFEADLNAKY